MLKKLKIYGLLICTLFLCCGCDVVNSGTTRDIRHAGYSVSNIDFECPTLFPSKTGYEKIKFFSRNYAITNSGTFYTLSLGRKYQNKLNCKVPDNFESVRVSAIMDDLVVKSDDDKLYYISNSNNTPAFSLISTNDSNYALYKFILLEEGVLKVMTVDSGSGHYYVLKNDGNVYDYNIVKNGNEIRKVGSSIVYGRSAYGGEILDFNYSGSSSETYVRTDTQIFRMVAQNKDECIKYADVPCDYKMTLDSNLSAHLDKMLGFAGNFILTDYGKQFSAAG